MANNMMLKSNGVGLGGLVAMCIGSMIGAGLFALPQNVACKAQVAAVFIAWIITFFGMVSLAAVFRNLSMRCQDLDAGIYSYAKSGFGDYLGFSSAWGYWISVWVGNVSYLVMLAAALSLFFPVFGDGTSWAAVIFSSTIIWLVTSLCLLGIRSASKINMLTTAVKVIPIVVFIVIVALAFKIEVFVANTHEINGLDSVFTQVRNMMLVTVWVFIGIEGANVYSARAKNRKDIGKATMLSFLLMFIILFAISLLPFGILARPAIAILENPSTGSLLAHITGWWGNVFMNIGLIIAILGAFLSWTLIAAEVPFIAGKKDGLFPKIFAGENKHNFPAGALIITAMCQQIFLIFVHFYHIGYLAAVFLAVAMILPPYLFTAIYALLLAIGKKTYARVGSGRRILDLVIGVVAVGYSLWLLYAAKNQLMLGSILYFLGSVVFIVQRGMQGKKIFNWYEILIFLILGILSIISLVTILTTDITWQ